MKSMEEMIVLAGGNPIGRSMGMEWFNDPVTKSTMVAFDGDNEYTVRRRILDKRAQFAAAEVK